MSKGDFKFSLRLGRLYDPYCKPHIFIFGIHVVGYYLSNTLRIIPTLHIF